MAGLHVRDLKEWSPREPGGEWTKGRMLLCMMAPHARPRLIRAPAHVYSIPISALKPGAAPRPACLRASTRTRDGAVRSTLARAGRSLRSTFRTHAAPTVRLCVSRTHARARAARSTGLDLPPEALGRAVAARVRRRPRALAPRVARVQRRVEAARARVVAPLVERALALPARAQRRARRGAARAHGRARRARQQRQQQRRGRR